MWHMYFLCSISLFSFNINNLWSIDIRMSFLFFLQNEYVIVYVLYTFTVLNITVISVVHSVHQTDVRSWHSRRKVLPPSSGKNSLIMLQPYCVLSFVLSCILGLLFASLIQMSPPSPKLIHISKSLLYFHSNMLSPTSRLHDSWAYTCVILSQFLWYVMCPEGQEALQIYLRIL